MNSKDVGNITEAKLIAKFVERGYTVSTVFGDNARYDIIIDIDGELFKIQCKTGRLKDGNVVFNTASVSPFTNVTNYYFGQIDFFAVYCPGNDEFYLVPPDSVAKSKGKLRITQPLKSDSRITWAKDYKI